MTGKPAHLYPKVLVALIATVQGYLVIAFLNAWISALAYASDGLKIMSKHQARLTGLLICFCTGLFVVRGGVIHP